MHGIKSVVRKDKKQGKGIKLSSAFCKFMWNIGRDKYLSFAMFYILNNILVLPDTVFSELITLECPAISFSLGGEERIGISKPCPYSGQLLKRVGQNLVYVHFARLFSSYFSNILRGVSMSMVSNSFWVNPSSFIMGMPCLLIKDRQNSLACWGIFLAVSQGLPRSCCPSQ